MKTKCPTESSSFIHKHGFRCCHTKCNNNIFIVVLWFVFGSSISIIHRTKLAAATDSDTLNGHMNRRAATESHEWLLFGKLRDDREKEREREKARSRSPFCASGQNNTNGKCLFITWATCRKCCCCCRWYIFWVSVVACRPICNVLHIWCGNTVRIWRTIG